MRILIVLTYYRPHTSGLTIYVERLSKSLIQRGHKVTILTSQFDSNLIKEEIQDGARIIRVPVLFHISKGVIMPSLGILATKFILENDIVHLHLPQFDAASIALIAKGLGKPTVITYHCDLTLPQNPFNCFVNFVVNWMNKIAAVFADRIVTYTQDFADHSPYLRRYAHKVRIITPPVELPPVSVDEINQFAFRYNIGIGKDKHFPVIGMAARFAAEKGVEVLLDALPFILERFPKTLVIYAGQFQNVLDEEDYFRRLSPRINEYQKQGIWQFLGVLNSTQMASFYHHLDILTVPSLNSTESFGLVQIEAMMNGVPVVASNLPGVRQPVKMTGMGEIAEVGDAHSLTHALLKVIENYKQYHYNKNAITQRFSLSTTAAGYEELYNELVINKHMLF
jgi:glycosyltransferase involved in cell wall biosynthesis